MSKGTEIVRAYMDREGVIGRWEFLAETIDRAIAAAAKLKAEVNALAGMEPGDVKALVRLLRQILDDLPTKRDWLDPAIESDARALLARLPKEGV